MKIVKTFFILLLVFTLFLSIGRMTVYGQYTSTQVIANDNGAGGQLYTPNTGCLGCAGTTITYGGNQTFAGFYIGNDGLNYPIGLPGVGGGDGPGAGPPVCTGSYSSCTDWSACSPTCGPGTQSRTCFDTGCGVPQAQSQACMINDPTVFVSWGACSTNCGVGTRNWINQCGTVGGSGACMVNDPTVWGTPTTCSVKCGTGTQNHTNQCGTTEAQACNTQACGPWIKLKDTSFVSPRTLTNIIVSSPTAYDADDTTEQYLIVGKAGVAVAPSIDIEISNIVTTQPAKTGEPEYKAIYTPNAFLMTPNSFLAYIRARKEFSIVTDLSQIEESGLYVYDGNVSVNSNNLPFNQGYNIVLVSTGTVTVTSAPDNTFTPVGSVAIVAPTITFSNSLTEASGIFIGNTISTGTNATQGLKIIGNLVAQTSLTNNRSWPTTARPSVFIKFDQAKYISLFPYLSTASYQWRQIQ